MSFTNNRPRLALRSGQAAGGDQHPQHELRAALLADGGSRLLDEHERGNTDIYRMDIATRRRRG
jgi:hypothetical protein